MRFAFLFCLPVMLFTFAAERSCAVAPESQRKHQDGSEFESLFNGRDFTGWTNTKGWKIDNGTIFREEGPPQRGASLNCVKKLPINFELRFEWKVRSNAELPSLAFGQYVDSSNFLTQDVHQRGDQRGSTSFIRLNSRYRAGGNWITLTTGDIRQESTPANGLEALGHRAVENRTSASRREIGTKVASSSMVE